MEDSFYCGNRHDSLKYSNVRACLRLHAGINTRDEIDIKPKITNYKKKEREIERETDTDRQTETEAETETDDRQTDRHIHRDRDRERQTELELELENFIFQGL